MKHFITASVLILFLSTIVISCISIPKETVTLSKKMGESIKILQTAHLSTVDLLFKRMENDVNAFVDSVYAPYIIHFMLSAEIDKYNRKESSLYGVIEAAGKNQGGKETAQALSDMSDFTSAVTEQVNEMRSEMLEPILTERSTVVNSVNQSYENLVHANSTITGYLESIRKVKDAEKEALNMIGLSNADSVATKALLNVADKVSDALGKAKDIDIKSDQAEKQFEEISKKIKAILNKKN